MTARIDFGVGYHTVTAPLAPTFSGAQRPPRPPKHEPRLTYAEANQIALCVVELKQEKMHRAGVEFQMPFGVAHRMAEAAAGLPPGAAADAMDAVLRLSMAPDRWEDPVA